MTAGKEGVAYGHEKSGSILPGRESGISGGNHNRFYPEPSAYLFQTVCGGGEPRRLGTAHGGLQPVRHRCRCSPEHGCDP